VSFYRNKAAQVKATARILATRYGGRVPDTLDELVTLPGVGRKTATLVLILAFRAGSTSAWIRTCTASRIGWAGCDEDARGDRAGALPATERAGGRSSISTS
jgi:hypothetical protein